jgi:Skp family chaperone for outer membrane proteins
MNMKRIIVTAAALVLLVAAAISAAGQTTPATPAPSTAKPAPSQPAQQPTPQPARAATAAVPDTRIAIVDTTMFGDAKVGVTRYLSALKILDDEFKPKTTELLNLQNQIKAIADEIPKLSGNPVVSAQTIQAKQVEGERLQRELKYKKEQADADYQKRYTEVVGPVSTNIGKALDAYASQHGITMTLDMSKLLPAVITMNPAMDITQAFIADFNSKNP